MHVYASAPTRNIGSELLVCVGRAASASIWILCVSPILLVAFPFQAALCIGMSIRSGSHAGHAHEYESVPLTSHSNDRHRDAKPPSHDANLSSTESDVETKQTLHSNQQQQHSQIQGFHNLNGLGQTQMHALQFREVHDSETEEGTMSCSSDIESDCGIRRYGAFSQLSVPSANVPTSQGMIGMGASHASAPTLSFSFAPSNLHHLSSSVVVPQSQVGESNTQEALVAAAIARESA